MDLLEPAMLDADVGLVLSWRAVLPDPFAAEAVTAEASSSVDLLDRFATRPRGEGEFC